MSEITVTVKIIHFTTEVCDGDIIEHVDESEDYRETFSKPADAACWVVNSFDMFDYHSRGIDETEQFTFNPDGYYWAERENYVGQSRARATVSGMEAEVFAEWVDVIGHWHGYTLNGAK